MRHAAKAYGKIANETANQRDLEANLLLRAAAQLQSACDNSDQSRSELDAALLYNRKLWSVFLVDVTTPMNPLPREVRQNIANLGIFVMKQTLAVMSDPRRDRIRSLIDINREIAAGLFGRP